MIALFDFTFPKRLSARDLVSLSLLFILIYGILWPMLAPHGLLQSLHMSFLLRGLGFVLLGSVIAYYTAFLVIQADTTSGNEVQKVYKVFFLSAGVVAATYVVHAITSVVLLLILTNLFTVPDWFLGNANPSSTSGSEVYFNVLLEHVVTLPGYFIHSLTFLAFFLVFSEKYKVIDSIQESVKSIGLNCLPVMLVLFIKGFLLDSLDIFVPFDLSNINLVIGSMLSWYLYSAYFVAWKGRKEKALAS